MDQDLKVGIILEMVKKEQFKEILSLDASSVHVPLDKIDLNSVQAVHLKGLKVYVYTVNELEDIKKMLKMKVDGLFSDYPDRVNKIIKEYN